MEIANVDYFENRYGYGYFEQILDPLDTIYLHYRDSKNILISEFQLPSRILVKIENVVYLENWQR